MRGAVLYEPNTALVIEELELPQVGPGHVLVRLVASEDRRDRDVRPLALDE
jgi:NADPH:quinone reductase-like Zn-dependent oxidoreductase